MLVTTTHHIEGFEITDYKGIVASETIMGTNVFRDLFASFRNFFGGRTKGYEKEMDKAREIVMCELIKKASDKRGNALVGVEISSQLAQTGDKNSGDLILVTATGTAVRIEQIVAI